MKKLFTTLTAACFFLSSFSQRLAQIKLTTDGNSDIISFVTEDAVIVNITRDGKIIDWGVENNTGRYYNYPGRLEKFMGRTDFYTANDNEDSRGKVKNIGRTTFTYYAAYENELLKGKIKNMGSIFFDYFNSYDDDAWKGKIKNAGSVSFAYYRSTDNDAYKGKFKNIGSSSLTYFSSFDDKAYRGKIKSIDNRSFSYYSSFDRPEYRGSMKGGNQPNYIINGVKYLLGN